MSLLNDFLALNGWAEVAARRIMYGVPPLKEFGSSLLLKNGGHEVEPTVSRQLLFKDIAQYGVKNGDILIVHSSMGTLSHQDANAKELIEYLLHLVGPEGTLVLPAYPAFNRKSITQADEPILYDPRRTLCWTGMMPNLFIRMPGVLRSSFPNNSLAAKGAHAEAMMQGNLSGDLPHGVHSAWAYCVEHHAKILFLGAQPHHSNTVVHVAEEILDDRWPIKDWFEPCECRIKTSEGIINFKFRRRRLFWARFMNEYQAMREYIEKGYLDYHVIDEKIPIGFIGDSNDFVDYIISEAIRGRTTAYSIPKRYYKRMRG